MGGLDDYRANATAKANARRPAGVATGGEREGHLRAEGPSSEERTIGCALAAMSLVELLDLLPDLEAEVDASYARLHACVAQLRERRASWREIGEALEVSRQAAWQRFRISAVAGEQRQSS
jgi:hypothetical protein